MRTTPIAAGAVLVLATGAIADPFTLSSIGLLFGDQGVIRPSQGSFITQLAEPDYENAYLLANNIAVTPDPTIWRNEPVLVMTSTWLAVDPYGPKGRLGTDAYGTGWATYKNGPAGITHAPTFTFSIAADDAGLAVNGTLGDPVNGDGLSPGFVAGHAGFGWGPSEHDGFQARSLFSSVNGREVDSLFVGHLVLSDPGADLASTRLMVAFSGGSPGAEAGTVNRMDIDGSPGEMLSGGGVPTGVEIPFHIESERTTFTNALGTFTAIDLYLVSTGAYPVMDSPPVGGGDDGDIGDGGDDTDTPPDDIPDLPGFLPPGPAPTPEPKPEKPKSYFTVSDIALVMRTTEPTPESLRAILESSGFDPHEYTAKQWKRLMKGLYNHRIAPSLFPKPTKKERKAAIAALVATYGIEPELADLTDTGTQDANGDGRVDFADIARILEVGGASPERLADTLNILGMDPEQVPSKKAWKSTVKAFYTARILPEFVGTRSKKQQSRDRKALIRSR
jgi:hypothetical protein